MKIMTLRKERTYSFLKKRESLSKEVEDKNAAKCKQESFIWLIYVRERLPFQFIGLKL